MILKTVLLYFCTCFPTPPKLHGPCILAFTASGMMEGSSDLCVAKGS